MDRLMMVGGRMNVKMAKVDLKMQPQAMSTMAVTKTAKDKVAVVNTMLLNKKFTMANGQMIVSKVRVL
jgi:hypothetical protein